MELSFGGSGIFIAPFTALTAKHVDRHFLRMDGRYPRLPKRSFETEYGCAAFQNPFPFEEDRAAFDGVPYATWEVRELWPGEFSDISVLQLSAEDGLSRQFQHELPSRFFEWMLTPPPVGSMVAALGFPDTKLDADGRLLSIDSAFLFERGYVTAVHEMRRDRGMLNFPCFEVGTPFPAGMSGGPVFFENRLCGIVSSGSTFDTRGHVASLWPMLRNKYGENKQFEFRDLFESGTIQSPGWRSIDSRIAIEEQYEGQFCRLEHAVQEAIGCNER